MGYGSFHTHTLTYSHKYINMQPVPLSACNHWQRGHSIEKTTTEERMNQGHHVEHAVAEWRTTNQKKKKKRGRKGGPLYPFLWTNQRGEGFLSHAMQEGGLAICVQVRDEPISTRLYVSHRVMGWKNSREREGRGFKEKKVVGKERGQGLFKPKRLPTAIILLLV